MIRGEAETCAYLTLAKHRFLAPPDKTLPIEVQLGEEIVCERGVVLEGNMRIKLSELLTAKILTVLEQGEAVHFCVDGLRQTVVSLPKKKIALFSPILYH